jgi:hypothetical protein
VCPFCAQETGQQDVRRAFSQYGEMGSESGHMDIDLLHEGYRGVHEVKDASHGAAMEMSHWSGFGHCSGAGIGMRDESQVRVLLESVLGRHSELQTRRSGPRASTCNTRVNRWVRKWLQHIAVRDRNSLQSLGRTPRRPSGACAALGKVPPSNRRSSMFIVVPTLPHKFEARCSVPALSGLIVDRARLQVGLSARVGLALATKGLRRDALRGKKK